MNAKQARKLIASEWVTMDGVFDADLMGTWFQPYESPERGQTIKRGIDASDAYLFGRVTYEMLAGYWPQQKNDVADRLNRQPKYVVSTTLKQADWNNSTIIAGNVVEVVTSLKQQPGQDLLMFGSGTLLQTLSAANLVDEYRFLVHPVVLGRGKRLWNQGTPPTGRAGAQRGNAAAPESDPVRLELVETQELPAGVLALTYRTAR
jgi:dihydrofolate reductase